MRRKEQAAQNVALFGRRLRNEGDPQ